MGREIRKVPQNHRHTQSDSGRYLPMYDENYADACALWLKECNDWMIDSNAEDRKKYGEYYWEGEVGPPEKDYYHSYAAEECIWFQMYETVSEGTPVTPSFETEGELIDYLVSSGTFWDSTPWPRGNAERFVSAGFAFSGIMVDGKVKTGSEIFD